MDQECTSRSTSNDNDEILLNYKFLSFKRNNRFLKSSSQDSDNRDHHWLKINKDVLSLARLVRVK